MLVPAITLKEEIEKQFMSKVYSDEYFMYTGYAYSNELPVIKLKDNHYQWAVVDGDKLVGYFAYYIDPLSDSAENFGLYSFDPGNPLVGLDVFKKIKELIEVHHRIEWRCISCNKITRDYDKFCEKNGGNRVVLHDRTKDLQGNYHDEIIYEIVNDLR